MDICHDHFGFYLAWGSTVWLPAMYTLQTQYLARTPVELSQYIATCILGTGIGGYLLFRSANDQKDLARRTNGQCTMGEEGRNLSDAHLLQKIGQSMRAFF